jgi:hypothetical protein
MKSSNLFFVITLLLLVSCGNNSGGGSGTQPAVNDGEVTEREAPEAESEREEETTSNDYDMVPASAGTYYTVLRPVNFHSNGFIPYGAATFTVKDDLLEVSTSMDDDQAVTHRQTLHIGTRCPTLADDKNGDGFVDYDEAMTVVGPALMPLDNDISSQLAGAGVYPKGRAMTYNKSASLSGINADLWKADENPADNIMKLASGKGIGFENRVVLIHGTAFEGEEAHISLPVVCGVLKKID